MAQPQPPFPYLLFLFLLPTISHSLTCTPTSNTPYKTCTNLPSLPSTLKYTFTPSNKTLSISFTSTPSKPNGWVAWGINPTSTGMAGTQALLAYKAPNGTISVTAYNISSYSTLTPGTLSFKVYDKKATFNSKDGSLTIFAKVESTGGKINHVWQVGPGVTNGYPDKHDFNPVNLLAKGSLDLSTGVEDSSGSASASGGSDNGLKKRNIHGILNGISWGILFPVGAIIARYLRTFDLADPAWFYAHATCQTSAYAIGVAGWATGIQLGNETKGIVFKGHRCIGIVLFCIATIQILALFIRPKKDHKFRFYWNIYHHSIGYAILILGIINVFKGFQILQPEKKWKSTYVSILIVLGGIAVILEAFTWIVVLRRKSRKSTKPYA